MERILDFSQPLDVGLLDNIVDRMYRGDAQERAATQKVLTQFQEHPEAWTRVDSILETSKSLNTKYVALMILDSVIKYRWKALPREQCEGIKVYIVNLVIRLSSDPQSLAREKTFINKLDNVLVQILKQEWPKNWESFIPEIVASSKTNESLCENNMQILKLLSEEVFDFSSGQMTQAKIKDLKTSFNREFAQIFELCQFILERATKGSLVVVTLDTLLRFLGWIPVGYIFETDIVGTLVSKYLPQPLTRNSALQCLTEIGSLSIGNNFDAHFVNLYFQFMSKLVTFLPPSTDIAAAHANGSDDDQMFIQYLALFFCGFFRSHIQLLEKPDSSQYLLEGLNYLVKISMVEEVEVFKICLEYWSQLASELYHETPYMPASPLLLGTIPLHASPRRVFYAPVLSKARVVLIGRVPRPEEVLIVEDDNGEIIRELVKDTDSITLYKSMRETLIYLTHLDCEDTQNIMLDKLAKQVDGSEWSWNNLNTLCWAVGSISGAQNEEYEKRFLVTVIKDLLGMCEQKRGKDNKAVVASNIMYVVGQYPRFLRAHWRFLKTVVNKLFEFMHETFPGIQDMACDTFLKIAQKTRKKFVVCQAGEVMPFVDEILATLPTIIADLEPHQVQSFYESMGHLISASDNPQQRDLWISKLMEYPNSTWSAIMAEAATNMSGMLVPETMKQMAAILKTNVKAATSLGHCYVSQLGKLFLDLLTVYKWYSEGISNVIATQGTTAAKFTQVLSMRAIKRETLRLLETFIERSEDPRMVTQTFLTPILNAILGDYQTNIPDARDAEVLSLMTCLVNRLQKIMLAEVPRILEAVLDCTLGMITRNFEDYPEHRSKFFGLMQAINAHCFQVFFQLPPTAFALLIDCVVWAFKHTERNISETGLNILLQVLHNVSTDETVANAFYQQFCVRLLQEVLVVLFDSWHKSGFKLQALILRTMFHAVESGTVKTPLWDPSVVADPTMTNQKYLRQFVENCLSVTNVSKPQVHAFVEGLFNLKMDLASFKNHLRDFMVQLKEFVSADNAELFSEEKEAQLALERQQAASIPGMIKPVDQPDEMAE